MKEQEEPKAEYDVEFEKPTSSSQHRDGSNGASSSQSRAYEEGDLWRLSSLILLEIESQIQEKTDTHKNMR